MDPWIASPPSRWADAEREFHLAYLKDPTPFPRQPVTVRWAAQSRSQPPAHFVALALWFVGISLHSLSIRWRTGAWPEPEFEVPSLRVTDAQGRTVWFPIDPGPAPFEGTGAQPGVLVGGHGSNAIACVEVAGRTLWPTGHPEEARRSDG